MERVPTRTFLKPNRPPKSRVPAPNRRDTQELSLDKPEKSACGKPLSITKAPGCLGDPGIIAEVAHKLEYKVLAGLVTVIPVLTALLVIPAAPAVRLGQLQIDVTGGAVVERQQHTAAIWANRPNVMVNVANEAPGFFQGKLKWINVPARAYLVSGRGVAEAVSPTAGRLVASISLAGGARSRWRLEPNISRDYRFAVLPSARATSGRIIRQTRSIRPQFAINLGGSSLGMAAKAAEALEFPSYLMPGSRDSASLVAQRIGEPFSAFSVGSDRFLLLDNRRGGVGKAQFDWIGKRVQGFRLDGARRVFVFFHRERLREGKRLGRLLRTVRTAAIFIGEPHRSKVRSPLGLKTYWLGQEDGMLVDSKDSGLSVYAIGRSSHDIGSRARKAGVGGQVKRRHRL